MKTKLLSLAATLLLAASVNTASATDYYLVGDFNNWTKKLNEYKFTTDDNNVYTITKTFGNKNFKIVDDNDNWYGANNGDPYWLTFINYRIDLASPGNNLYLERECEYTFTISDGKLTISGFDIFVAGSFNGWNWGEAQKMAYNEDGSYTKEILITENTEFKFTNFQGDNRKYIGAVSNGPFHVLNTMYSNLSLEMPGENFLIQRPGRYTLKINSDKKLTVEGFPPTPLYDTQQSNSPTLEEYNNKTVDIELNGRKFYKDGYWNTLCLPFDLSAEELAKETNPLYGADIRTFTSSSFSESNGELTLNFSEEGAVKSITAGTPYIIRWNGSNGVIEYPVFKQVTIKNVTEGSVGNGPATFKGIFNPYYPTAGDKNTLFIGEENTLYFPEEGSNITIGAFRAYFVLDLPTESSNIKSFVLNFDEETTSIKQVNNAAGNASAWYTLDGRRLNEKPAAAGLYINNGKKVVIK